MRKKKKEKRNWMSRRRWAQIKYEIDLLTSKNMLNRGKNYQIFTLI